MKLIVFLVTLAMSASSFSATIVKITEKERVCYEELSQLERLFSAASIPLFGLGTGMLYIGETIRLEVISRQDEIDISALKLNTYRDPYMMTRDHITLSETIKERASSGKKYFLCDENNVKLGESSVNSQDTHRSDRDGSASDEKTVKNQLDNRVYTSVPN